ncbi:unnamed protein product, partial [marine sediment metagenome]
IGYGIHQHRYALAIHGSLQRDFDVIAIPWGEKPTPPEEMVKIILSLFAFKVLGEPETRLHNRLVYTLGMMGELALDLSFMPSTQ